MIEKINDTLVYWSQYHDVTDLPETLKDERTRTCNITCVAMILGVHPDDVLTNMIRRYGLNDKFQWESNLINYLKEYGCVCKEITKHAYPKPRRVTEVELTNMMLEIDKGKIIFYHKAGHYQIMVGYRIKKSIPEFIFNDPAGNRNLLLYKRRKSSGHLITYSRKKVMREKIYGSCWSVEIS